MISLKILFVQRQRGSGVVPVSIRPPHPQNLATTLPTVRMIVNVSRAVAILSTSPMIKLLKCKESRGEATAWPLILDIDDASSSSLSSSSSKLRRSSEHQPGERKLTDVAYLVRSCSSTITTLIQDFSVSPTGQLSGVVISAGGVSSLCRSLKLACELYPSRYALLCLDPYCRLGFALWTLSRYPVLNCSSMMMMWCQCLFGSSLAAHSTLRAGAEPGALAHCSLSAQR